MLKGNMYRVLIKNGLKQDIRILNFNNKTKVYTGYDLNDTVLKKVTIRESNIDSVQPKRSASIKKAYITHGKDASFLYIFKTDENTYKFGCSDNVIRRMKQIRTTSAMTELMAVRQIPREKSSEWKRYESSFQSRFKRYQCEHGGKEMFKMPKCIANKAVKQLSQLVF